MQITTQELDPSTLLLEIEVEPERVNRAFERAVRHLSRNLRIPGFRPGTAPRHVVEQFLSEADIKREAAHILVTDTLTRALQEQQVIPFSTPRIEVEQVEEDEPFRFKATVPLPPQVELGEYKGLPLRKVRQEVYERELDSALSDIQNQLTTHSPQTERGAQSEDRALIVLRSLEKENAEPDHYMVVVGRSFGELDNVLAGMKQEDVKTVTMTFPSDFQNPDLAGQMQTVEITLKELYEPVVPPVDDTLAQRMNFENLESLKQHISERILEEKERLERRRLEAELLNQIRAHSTLSLPQTLVEEHVEAEIERLEKDLQERGMNLTDYAMQTGQSAEALMQQLTQQTYMRLQNSFLLFEIAKREQIEVQEEEINAEIEKLASEAGYEASQVRNLQNNDRLRSRVSTDLLMHKVLDFLLDSAQVEETEVQD